MENTYLNAPLVSVMASTYSAFSASVLREIIIMNFLFRHKRRSHMFEMINEEKPSSEERKLLLFKVGAFIAGIAAMAGVIYLVAFSYAK